MNFYTCFHNAYGKKWKRTWKGIPVFKPDVLFGFPIAISIRKNLTVFFLALFCLMTSAAVYGQSITISVKNAPLENVFKLIEKQSGYLFWCDNDLLKKAKPIDLSLRNANLSQTLEACFKDQALSYVIKGKTIIVKAVVSKAPKSTLNDKSIDVSGKVTTETGQPLAGASIKIKGSAIVTSTDVKGEFRLDNASAMARLQISFIGYETQEIPAGTNLTITLLKRTSSLDDVQVIAYGTTTQRLNTGSVVSVKAKDIESQPISNPLAALQGRVAGLVITQQSGVPGSAFNVQLRGQSSLDLSLSQNNPLFVIDGVPFDPGNAVSSQVSSAANNPTSATTGGISPLNTINPLDIESVDVLKDADATSIYGSRGANGVILITTKKGKPGKTNISLNLNSGFSRVGKTMDLLNTQQYLQIRKEAFANDGLTPGNNANDPGFAPDLTLWDTSRYTDFKKLLIGNTGYYSNFQTTISGGSDYTQFRVGGNFHRETSVYPGNYSDKVSSVSFSINHSSSNKRFSFQFSGLYSNDKNQLPKTDLTRYINLPPNQRLYDDAGKLSWDENGVQLNALGLTNPLAILNSNYTSINDNLSANANLQYRIVTDLSLKVNLGYNSFVSDERTSRPSTSIDPNIAAFTLPSAEFASRTSKSWIVEPQLQYIHATNYGKINVLLGTTFQNRYGKSNDINGSNYSSDLLLNSISAAGLISARNDEVNYRYSALFGRITYNLDDKYLVNFTGRRDGSSRFGPGRQWANFGAVGLAWVFSAENFLKDDVPFLSFGKLRASYGTTGNDQIGDYKFLNLWAGTTNGYNGVPGLSPKSLFNPDYNWEINRKLEIGMDLGFLKHRILFNVAYYNNRSSNQLVRYPLPSQTGFTDVVRNFPGLVQNTGYEFTLSTTNITSEDIRWTSSLNISVPKNKLVSFPGLSASSYKLRYVEGRSLSIIRGLNYLGVDPQTGLYTFEDVNKDGVIYDGDYQYFGNTDPKLFGGIQNNISYRNFELSFFFQFTKQTGINYINQLASYAPGSLINQPAIVLDRWQQPGDNKEIQKLTSQFESLANSAISSLSVSNGAYTDASFIKLKNISLSYTLPKAILKKLTLGNCKLYADVQNVLTISGYKGADPETQNFYILPPQRTFVAGMQLNF